MRFRGTFFDTFGFEKGSLWCHSGYANHLLGRYVKLQTLTLGQNEGMKKIRSIILSATEYARDLVQEQFNTKAVFREIHQDVLKRMLLRYDDNPSKFSTDLCSSVLRQCGFIDNILALAYLSSPFRHQTIASGIDRFLRFLVLLHENPDTRLAPPMDVDLIWHTLQLNPKSYMTASLKITGTLIDHEDKPTKKGINMSLSKTDKLWKSTFPDDPLGYDSCTCVYCESERAIINLQSVTRKSKSKPDAAAVDGYYGRACEEAWMKGSMDVRRLNPLTAADGRSATDFRHPYLAFTPAAVERHESQLDFTHGNCLALNF